MTKEQLIVELAHIPPQITNFRRISMRFRKFEPAKSWVLFSLIILASGFILSGCAGKGQGIQIKGSDTMVNLSQAWAEAYMKENPTVSIAITGGGSGTGVAALINSTTNIAASSRNMAPKEIKLANLNKVNPKEFKVAIDGMTIVVNLRNPVSKLTIPQLSDIYTGKITNWSQVGGPNRRIVALSRERNSGTHVVFLNDVVKLGDKKSPNEFANTVLMMPSSQTIVEEVASNQDAIGYLGLGYLNNRTKALQVAKTGAGPYVYPDLETVASGKYPLGRPLFLYTNGEPTGNVAKFISYVLSAEGQAIVKKMDFVPLKGK